VSVADSVTLAARWGSQDNGDGEFFGPHGIALDVAGNVYVTDVNNNRVQVFGADGRFLRKWG
jgi:tripartite motif-containing protein 71